VASSAIELLEDDEQREEVGWAGLLGLLAVA
jgi:hypothetical protein